MATINDPTTATSIAAVKAASTAPAATDPALVVAISPNSASGTIGSVKITDGTNTAAVKPTTTAAVAADPALVVTISPNMPASGQLRQDLINVAGSAVSTAAAGIQKVGVVGNAGAAVDAVAGAAAPANVVFTSTAQVGTTAVSTAAAGVQKVGVVGNAGAAFDAVAGAAAPANVAFTALAQIGATAAATAAAGVLKVGIVGNANAAVDAVQGAAAPANVLWTVAIPRPSDLFVTNTAAVNTGFTVTLPAVASSFHYITSIQIVRATNATATAAGAALTITTTNLPGSPVWTFGNASTAGGTTVLVDLTPTTPLKSSVANTNTTIVVPAAGAGEILRANVSYYAAP